MRITLAVLVTLCLAATAPAGDTYIPDSTPSGTCNVIPFSPTWPNANGEWRYQAVMPASLMGGKPLLVSGFSLAPCGTGNFTTTTFEIRMNNLPPNTHGSNMDTNIGLAPSVVKIAAPFAWNITTTGTWQAIKLDCPHVYDGNSDLVIEVRYSGGMAPGFIGMARAGVAQRYYVFGAGAYSNPTASGSGSAAFKVRLTQADITPSSATPSIGTTVNLALDSFPNAGQLYVCASSFSQASIPIGCWTLPLALDDLFKVTTQNLLPSIFQNYQGTLDANGQATASVNIPNFGGLVGIAINTAFVTFDPTTSTQAISRAGTFKIAP